MLLGRKFPRKAFLLTFIDACGIDLENDRRWEQAWDRLAVQYRRQDSPPPGEVERLRQENEDLRQQLAAAQEPAADVPAADVAAPTDGEDFAPTITLHPRTYKDCRMIGEHFRCGTAVFMNLTDMPDSQGPGKVVN